MTYNLGDLEQEELNLILSGLAQLPYFRSAQIIAKITERIRQEPDQATTPEQPAEPET